VRHVTTPFSYVNRANSASARVLRAVNMITPPAVAALCAGALKGTTRHPAGAAYGRDALLVGVVETAETGQLSFDGHNPFLFKACSDH
jgi:hypothetical protein